ncbi:GNAT family N-acetyltransferase [Janthinobacterium sp. MDT1-19]|uniref:GNAT family N-acetyltransferase n=1 Tax=Janthinobacterium sp. MDT1-19 TaxID=1259339 RepID=UPI003F269739
MGLPNLLLRPAILADQAFAEVLYSSTRDDLHMMVSDSTVIKLLISMQYHAQVAGYKATYSDAEYWIIEMQGVAVGRVVIDSVAATLRIVDISVLPGVRRQGCAGEVLRRMQGRAAMAGQEMRLTVHQSNSAARRLYLTLGFCVESEDALSAHLRWHA